MYGWKINFLHYPEDELDEHEQFWIKRYAKNGYQLPNKTAGGGARERSRSASTDRQRDIMTDHAGEENAGKRTVTYHGKTSDCGIEAGEAREQSVGKAVGEVQQAIGREKLYVNVWGLS